MSAVSETGLSLYIRDGMLKNVLTLQSSRRTGCQQKVSGRHVRDEWKVRSSLLYGDRVRRRDSSVFQTIR